MRRVSLQVASDCDPQDIPALGRYRHFKGGEYELVSVGIDSESKERVAIYHPVGEPETIWVRPLDMWDGPVVTEQHIRARFEPAPLPGWALALTRGVDRVVCGAARGLTSLKPNRADPPRRAAVIKGCSRARRISRPAEPG